MKKSLGKFTLLAVVLGCGLGLAGGVAFAQTATLNGNAYNLSLLPRVAPNTVPPFGTFHRLTRLYWPPLPFNNVPGCPVYSLGGRVYLIDDTQFDYAARDAAASLLASLAGLSSLDPASSGQGFQLDNYGPNDLWLEILPDPNDTSYVDVLLHGATNGLVYELFSKPDLNPPLGLDHWTPIQYQWHTGPSDTLDFDPIPKNAPMMFYRATGGHTVVSVLTDTSSTYVTEPACSNCTANPGLFRLYLQAPVDAELTVTYTLSGTAVDGTDYTNLSGTVTFPTNATSTEIYLQPRYDTQIEFDEPVILTLTISGDYVLDPNYYRAQITIQDNFCTNCLFTVVATNVPYGTCIDYLAPSNSLLLGVVDGDSPAYNLALLHTNNLFDRWSGINGYGQELKFGTIKATANGFTNGDVYFGAGGDGNPSVVVQVAASGAASNLNWCVLSNATDVETDPVRGGVYVDQTGLWGGDLMVVTGDAGMPLLDGSRGVWRVNSQGTPRLVTRIPTGHLEGLVTLPNDPRYGPWAGKLITGDEWQHVIYAVDTNGVATPFYLGIDPDDFHVIATNQDLYCVDFLSDESWVLKISKNYFTNYVGDILIEQAGEMPGGANAAAKLFIVHWDDAITNFVTRSIDLNTYFPGHFEHVTFAPINIPSL